MVGTNAKLAAAVEAYFADLRRVRASGGAGLSEYLYRALSHRTAFAKPKDLAWLFASYARDGARAGLKQGSAPSLKAARSALGVRFESEQRARFFRSTLVQTPFYGVFPAWMLWARMDGKPENTPPSAGSHSAARFHWREAVRIRV